MREYATYLRVSTKKQGNSGLGLDAQRKMCSDFISANNGTMSKEFVDVESGTHRNRKGLQDAIAYCKSNACPLVIAKLDRLARDVEFCFRVVNTGIEIHFVDMPTINTLLLGVFAAVAQYERELTSDRTKKALAIKKEKGAKLGASSDKYIRTRSLKSEKDIKDEYSKRGDLKRQRHQESRNVQMFLRILRNVFPEATRDEDPSKWKWEHINTRGTKEQILEIMKDYQQIDSELFHGWGTFDPDDRRITMKLCSFIQATRKSFVM